MDTTKGGVGPQEGSGSAENTGQGRQEQQQNTQLSGEEKSAIAADTNIPTSHLAGLHDLGAVSGREDLSGGDNDHMENESSGEPTGR